MDESGLGETLNTYLYLLQLTKFFHDQKIMSLLNIFLLISNT